MSGWIGVDLELAWAAGFFDGEGCVFVRHTKRHKGGNGKLYPLLTVESSIAQVRREPLDRFCAAVGVGVVRGPYKSRAKNQSPSYRWCTAGRPRVHALLTRLWPHLSAPKREQARRCWGELREKRTVKSPRLEELPL